MGIIDTTESPEVYHATKSVSKSGIDQMLRTPAHFRAWFNGLGGSKQTEAMLCGSVFHCLALEPAVFTKRYFVRTCPGNTAQGRAEADSARKCGLAIITTEMFGQCQKMAEAVRRHPLFGTLEKAPDVMREASIYWQEEIDGHPVPCKARIDLAGTVAGIGMVPCDLKSTADADPDALQGSAYKWGYHRQATWYRRALARVGLETQNFVLLAVEKEPPYIVTAADISEGAVTLGERECDEALRRYVECTLNNYWPGYHDGKIVKLHLPEWAYLKELEA